MFLTFQFTFKAKSSISILLLVVHAKKQELDIMQEVFYIFIMVYPSIYLINNKGINDDGDVANYCELE